MGGEPPARVPSGDRRVEWGRGCVPSCVNRDMAFPKGPPKSSATPFWLVVASVSLLLLLLWGWQAGMLGKAGDFLARLVTPASYDGSGSFEQREQKGQDLGADRAADEGAASGTHAEDQPGADAAAAGNGQTGDADPAAGGGDAAADGAGNMLAAPQVADESQVVDVPVPQPAIEPAPDKPARKADKAAPHQMSEAAVNKELARHWPLSQLRQFFNLQEQARRLVVTVDNLSGTHVPSQLRVARGVPELLVVDKQGESITLDERNFQRYEPFIGFAESLDARTLGRLYAKFYPLLQHTYEETGFPGQRFHDRVLAAIDDMLAAPRVTGEIRLVQPKVLYRFEDAELEDLSPGQKIMIRIGPRNADRVKAVLKRVRAAIVARDPGR